MVDKLYALVEKWREDARRVRPLESAPVSSAKRQDALRWMLWTNCANELAAALTAQGETAPQHTDDCNITAALCSCGASDWHGEPAPAPPSFRVLSDAEMDDMTAEVRASVPPMRHITSSTPYDPHNHAIAAADAFGETAPAPVDEPRCVICGARRASHYDFVDGVAGHRIDMPGMPQHGIWHPFTAASPVPAAVSTDDGMWGVAVCSRCKVRAIDYEVVCAHCQSAAPVAAEGLDVAPLSPEERG